MSHSVVAAGMFVGVFALAATATGAATVLSVQTSVHAAADASALAAADTLVGLIEGEPCARAAEIAALNRVTLRSCTVSALSVHVSVTRRVAGISLEGFARAGLSE